VFGPANDRSGNAWLNRKRLEEVDAVLQFFHVIDRTRRICPKCRAASATCGARLGMTFCSAVK
jgi:transposase